MPGYLSGTQLIKQLNISNVVDVGTIQKTNLKPVASPLKGFEQKFCIAVQEGDKELLSRLNEGLSIVIANGVYDDLYNKWLGPILPSPPVNIAIITKYVLLILLPILGLLGILGIWYLKKEVSLKTKKLTVQIQISEAAKSALKERETHLRTLVDALPDLVWVKDLNGVYLSCNTRFEDFFGARETEIIGKTDYDFLDKEKADFFKKKDQEIISQGEPGTNEETITFANDGHSEIVETIKTPLYDTNGDLVGVLGIGRNITQRKQVEDLLRHERDQFNRIMETSPAGITRLDAKGNMIYANRRAEEILGVPLSDLVERTYNDPAWKITNFDGSPYPEEQLPFNVITQTRKPLFDLQHAIEWPDGRRLFLSINAMPFFTDSDVFDGIVVSLNDITKNYQAEQKYQILFNEMIDGFALHEIICNKNGHPIDYRFLTVNPAFERLTQLSGKVLVGKTVLEVLPKTESHWIETYGQVALTGEPISFENYSQELNRYFQVTAFRPAINQFACIIVDMSERKQAEKDRKTLEGRLQQAQKMESIGNLAGGIAHDFNNILFPILGMSEMLMEDLAPDSMEYESVKEIFIAGKRGSELVKQILAFSRQTEKEMIPVRVQQIVKEVLKLIRSTIPANIEISYHLQPDCGLVMADPTKIHQVAMNLVTNAYHAVEETDGKINVQLQEITLKDDDLANMALEQGEYVMLTVSDTGCGIDPEALNKIFEPYFTTKAQGKGTGLGLSVVYGIVNKHKGYIEVFSEPLKGTTFNVYLPNMDKSTKNLSLDAIDVMETGTERILIVDDEVPIAQLEKIMLERMGYDVVQRTSSKDALKAFMMNPGSFDLVISDMSMPRLTGIQLAKEIFNIRQDLPIIICTGFSEKITESIIKETGIKAILMKPVIKSKMAKMVRKVLDEAKGITPVIIPLLVIVCPCCSIFQV